MGRLDTASRNNATGTEEHKASVYSINKDDLFLVILSVFLPPIPVWIRKGFFSKASLLNCILFLLFFFPAILHALYVIHETSSQRGSGTYASVSSVETSIEQQPVNGTSFNVDLESQIPEGDHIPPTYDEVVDAAALNANLTDNKIQD